VVPATAQQAEPLHTPPALAPAAAVAQNFASPTPIPELLTRNVVIPLRELYFHPPTIVPASEIAAPDSFRHRLTLNLMTASYEALQAADVITTVQAIRRGAREQNPVMQGVASHPLRLALVKASVTTATLVMTHRIVKRHRLGGMLLLAGLNGTLAIVVSRNMQANRQ
jgi:hypothetical protein